jgi:hypothetical protein
VLHHQWSGRVRGWTRGSGLGGRRWLRSQASTSMVRRWCHDGRKGGAAAHGRSTRTASSGWHYRAGPDGTSEGAHRGVRSRGAAHQLRRQGGTLAELAPVLASVPTVNASPQRWRYGFANEWRSCGLGNRPALPEAAAAVRRPSCSHAPVTSRSPRHRALIRLRWPAVACLLGCLVEPDQAATFVITQEFGDPRPRDGGSAGSCSRRKN